MRTTQVRYIGLCLEIRKQVPKATRKTWPQFNGAATSLPIMITVFLPPLEVTESRVSKVFRLCGTKFVWMVHPQHVEGGKNVAVCEHMIEID